MHPPPNRRPYPDRDQEDRPKHPQKDTPQSHQSDEESDEDAGDGQDREKDDDAGDAETEEEERGNDDPFKELAEKPFPLLPSRSPFPLKFSYRLFEEFPSDAGSDCPCFQGFPSDGRPCRLLSPLRLALQFRRPS